MSTTSALLVRHGQSEWNASGRWQGQADPPLTELGVAQARAAAAAIGQVDAVVASDLQRAAATALIIANAIGVGPVLTDERLRERATGPWTGLTRREIEAQWPGWIDAGRRPDGFEQNGSVHDRVAAFLVDLHREWAGGAVLVVTHGGVIRAVEHELGAHDAGLVPNLGARWLQIDDRGSRLGERLVLIDHEHVAVTASQQL